jgi:hypothetical protein
MANSKPVYCCDIAEFDAMQGKLINKDWEEANSQTSVDQINFNYAYSKTAIDSA